MTDTRIVTLQSLLLRLEDVLGSDSLLFKRFQQGFHKEDERVLTDAMTSLKLYPEATQRVVEDTVMGWLFGQRSAERRLPASQPPQ